MSVRITVFTTRTAFLYLCSSVGVWVLNKVIWVIVLKYDNTCHVTYHDSIGQYRNASTATFTTRSTCVRKYSSLPSVHFSIVASVFGVEKVKTLNCETDTIARTSRMKTHCTFEDNVMISFLSCCELESSCIITGVCGCVRIWGTFIFVPIFESVEWYGERNIREHHVRDNLGDANRTPSSFSSASSSESEEDSKYSETLRISSPMYLSVRCLGSLSLSSIPMTMKCARL